MHLAKVHPGKISLKNLTVAYATVATVWIRPWFAYSASINHYISNTAMITKLSRCTEILMSRLFGFSQNQKTMYHLL